MTTIAFTAEHWITASIIIGLLVGSAFLAPLMICVAILRRRELGKPLERQKDLEASHG